MKRTTADQSAWTKRARLSLRDTFEKIREERGTERAEDEGITSA